MYSDSYLDICREATCKGGCPIAKRPIRSGGLERSQIYPKKRTSKCEDTKQLREPGELPCLHGEEKRRISRRKWLTEWSRRHSVPTKREAAGGEAPWPPYTETHWGVHSANTGSTAKRRRIRRTTTRAFIDARANMTLQSAENECARLYPAPCARCCTAHLDTVHRKFIRVHRTCTVHGSQCEVCAALLRSSPVLLNWHEAKVGGRRKPCLRHVTVFFKNPYLRIILTSLYE